MASDLNPNMMKTGTYLLVKKGLLKGQIVRTLDQKRVNELTVLTTNGSIHQISGPWNTVELAVETTNTPTGLTAFLVPKEIWEPLRYDLKWGDKVVYLHEEYLFLCYRPNNQVEVIQQGTNKHYTVSIETISRA